MLRKLAKEIYAAGKEGELPPIFGPGDVEKACRGWSKRTYSVFLPKHRIGNPGGESELFERVAPGRYKLLGTKRRSFVFAAALEQDADGRWSSWVDSLPGCAAWGYTEEEALMALKDAAELYIEDMLALEQEVPTHGVDDNESRVITVRL
ncbi:MAG: hypothetical protein BZY80_07035 [SAR202 cluster bacterium Io17-Chloro-G2]|nr:MAG: hypothetical protein BZY80_07035 [SAR202 cluster bacterium Io17-Chloro-G2]